MKATTKQTTKKTLKIVLIAVAVIAAGVVGYRYYNRPVQTWNADVFEGRNPDKIETKGQGQKYWTGNAKGDGFYITDEVMSSSDSKVYCVSGAVATDAASFTLGDSTSTDDNGFFTHCAKLSVNDKHQLNFSVESGGVQVYRVDRKR